MFCRVKDGFGGYGFHAQVGVHFAGWFCAWRAFDVGDNLYFFVIAGIGPGWVIGSEEADDFAFKGDGDVSWAGVVCYDKVG